MCRLKSYTVTVVDSLSGDERCIKVKAFSLEHAQLIILEKVEWFETVSSILVYDSRGTMKGE